MNIYNFTKILTLILSICLMVTTSCSEDMSLDEMDKKYRENRNDLLYNGLRGPVKSIKERTYRWVSVWKDTIQLETLENEVVYEYDRNGFLKSKVNYDSLSFYYYENNQMVRTSKWLITSSDSIYRDSRNRITFEVSNQFTYNNSTIPSLNYRYTESYTYNDKENTAVLIKKEENFSNNDTVLYIEMYEYKLNSYGEIFEGNYKYYNLTPKSITIPDELAPQDDAYLSYRNVVEYDYMGNPILSYKLDYDYSGSVFSISGYLETEYEYY